MGKDTHALSGPAQRTALEVLAANGVETVIQRDDGVTPTPVVSRAILVHNRGRDEHLADGIVVTPSHNPPEDGGFKYNPPNGGPADTRGDARGSRIAPTSCCARATRGVKRMPLDGAMRAATTRPEDCVMPYVEDLRQRHRHGGDPRRRASRSRWIRSAAPARPTGSRSTPSTGSTSTVVNPAIDPTFSFMTVDHDGRIRMDCSSPYAMARLVELKDRYRVAFANDPDADRHGIVTPVGRADEPQPLSRGGDPVPADAPPALARDGRGRQDAGVELRMIDRVVAKLGRQLCEVPVGFKWFAPGLFDGSFCFGGEESAGASFLRRDGTVWTTDKDGLIMNLLAAEITARTGRDPGEHYRDLAAEFGAPLYTRIDAAGHAGAEGEARQAVAGSGDAPRRSPASRSRRS